VASAPAKDHQNSLSLNAYACLLKNLRVMRVEFEKWRLRYRINTRPAVQACLQRGFVGFDFFALAALFDDGAIVERKSGEIGVAVSFLPISKSGHQSCFYSNQQQPQRSAISPALKDSLLPSPPSARVSKSAKPFSASGRMASRSLSAL
jgi:hypothetical protein